MKNKKTAGRNKKRLAALLIVAVTAAYLGITAAVAQTNIVSQQTELPYTPDVLSFGDIYGFSEDIYQKSNYGLINAQQTVSLYNSKASDTKTQASYTFYKYYGAVTTGDHSGIDEASSVKMENHAWSAFSRGYSVSEAPAAVTGETIPTLSTGSVGVYATVPGSTGTYRVYVYAPDGADPSGHVAYDILDSYEKANRYVDLPTGALSFTKVEGTDFWYAEIDISHIKWSAYYVTAAASSSTSSSETGDTGGGQSYQGQQLSNTTLTNSYYYNVWTTTEIYYDTLLVLSWDSSVQLAPITKAGDTITINNGDYTLGSLTAVNAFGEPVTVGSTCQSVHAPIYITATPSSAEYTFSGFTDSTGANAQVTSLGGTLYRYRFETTASLNASWQLMEHLPSISVKSSSGYNGTMDFYAGKTASTVIAAGAETTYTFKANFADASDLESLTYTVTSGENQSQSIAYTSPAPADQSTMEDDISSPAQDSTSVDEENAASSATDALPAAENASSLSVAEDTAPAEGSAAPSAVSPDAAATAGSIPAAAESVLLSAAANSGTALTADNDTFSVKVQWESVTITFVASGKSGKTYSATFTVSVNSEDLPIAARIGNTTYSFVEDALAAARSGDTVEIINDATFFAGTPKDEWAAENAGYTVKSGVTLVVPYAEGQIALESSSGKLPYANYDDTTDTASALDINAGLYRTLTIPAGVTVYNSGVIAVGGTIVGTGNAGACSGAHSNIRLDGNLVINNGGALSSVGYVLGDGVVTAADSNAKIYQPFVINDFRGGGYTVASAGKSYAFGTQSGESYVSPFTRYTAQNIQVQVELSCGNYMYGYCDLYASGSHNFTTSALIGDSTVSGLIKLKSGAKLTSVYDAETAISLYGKVGRTTITITGGAEFGYLSLTTSGQTIYTKDLTFPVPYNYAINLQGEGSVYDIIYSMSMLPGSQLSVGHGAILNVGSSSADDFRFMIYDGLNDHTSSGSSKAACNVNYNNGSQTSGAYPITAALQAADFCGAAELVIDGQLNILSGVSFGGVVQTGGSGSLVMNASAVPSCTMQSGMVGKGSVIVGTYRFAGATVRTLTAQVIDNGTGKRVDVQAGKTYYGAAGADALTSYTYTLYTSSDNTSLHETHTEQGFSIGLQGSWYNREVNVHTVAADGTKLSSTRIGFADGADVSSYYTDAACTVPAATVSESTTDLYGRAAAMLESGANTTYYPDLRSAVKAAITDGDIVTLLSDMNLGQSVVTTDTQHLTIDLNGHTVSYTATPFVNNGELSLKLSSGEITNATAQGGTASYAAASAISNNVGATLTLSLSGGRIYVQAPAGSTGSLHAVTNYGTMSVADSVGTGGIYCYGPLGADEADWHEITVTTTLSGTPTATVKAEIYAQRWAEIAAYSGILNTGTITEISGGTIRSPMYGVFNGSADAASYYSWSLARATAATASGARIDTISGGTLEGGYAGLMNSGAAIGQITGGTFRSTGTLFLSGGYVNDKGARTDNSTVDYCALYNAMGTVGDISNAQFLSENGFTLTRKRAALTADGQMDSTSGSSGSYGSVTSSNYGIYNYAYQVADNSAGTGYSAFSASIGSITGCTLRGNGTALTSGLLSSSYSGAYTNTVNNVYGTALLNAGGTVGNITGSTIEGNRGISNQNLFFSKTVYNIGSSSDYTLATTTRTPIQTGSVGSIRDTDITANYQYGILNYGHIDSLCGSTTVTSNAKVTQGYAVYNHNGWYNGTVSCQTITERESYTNASGKTAFRNAKITYTYDDETQVGDAKDGDGLAEAKAYWTTIRVATIGSITDNVTIQVVNNGASTDYGYALWNGGRIDTIGSETGSVTIRTVKGTESGAVAPNYALLNSGGYIGRIAGSGTGIHSARERALQNSGSRARHQVTEYTYNADNTSTTADKTVTTTDYAVPAYIDCISGAELTAATSYALMNHGWINRIENAALHAETNYGLYNQWDSSCKWQCTVTMTTANVPEAYEADNPGYKDDRTLFGAHIGTVTGSDISARQNYAMLNSGSIDLITGGTQFSAANYALQNDAGRYSGWELQRHNLGKVDEINASRYLTLIQRSFVCLPGGGWIGTLENSTASATTSYGINNAGTIDTMQGVTAEAASYAINNGTTAAYSTRSTAYYAYGTAKLGTGWYMSETDISFDRTPAHIGVLSNVTATATTKYALQNVGTIDEIRGSAFTASQQYGILNQGRAIVKRTLTDDGSSAATPFYLQWFKVNSAKSGYSMTGYDAQEEYSGGVIGLLGDGNTINAAGDFALANKGRIDAIEGSETLITSSGGRAVYSFSGYYSKATRTTGTLKDDTASGVPASIGSVSSVAVTAKTYAIQNGDGGTTFGTATIDTLGDGLFASSTGSHAVYNRSGAQLTAISGGVYTGGGSGYALYNENAKAAVSVEGGYFKGGAAARANAIRNADNAAYTAYPQGKALSLLPVTPPKGSSATHYTLDRADYGITVTSCLNGSGQTVADVALSGTGTYSVAKYAAGEKITLAASESAGFRFLGWYKKTSGSSYSGTPWQSGLSVTTTLTDLLKEVGADADGSIALAAVYEPTSEKLKLTVTGKRFTLNGDAQTDQFTAYYPAGTEITLALSDDSFLYWTNGGDKVVKHSDGSAYTFTLVTPTELTAVYKSDDSAKVRVSFLSESGRVVSSRCYAAGDAVTLPDKQPSKLGYRFTGWDKTAEEIAAAIGSGSAEVLVYPTYTKLAGTYTVKAFNGTEVLSEQAYALGDTASVTAPDVDGQVFRFWASDASGTSILSYRQTYSFRVTRDVEIYAIYGSSAPEAQPLVRVDDILPQENSGVRRLTFMTSANIPENYELVELGVLLSRDASAATQDGMVIEMAGVTGSGIVKAASNLSSAAEPGKSDFSYTVNVRVPDGQEANTVYLRVYAAVRRNDSSEITYYYSDIASASYTNLKQGG